jgi:hypothetical protein
VNTGPAESDPVYNGRIIENPNIAAMFGKHITCDEQSRTSNMCKNNDNITTPAGGRIVSHNSRLCCHVFGVRVFHPTTLTVGGSPSFFCGTLDPTRPEPCLLWWPRRGSHSSGPESKSRGVKPNEKHSKRTRGSSNIFDFLFPHLQSSHPPFNVVGGYFAKVSLNIESLLTQMLADFLADPPRGTNFRWHLKDPGTGPQPRPANSHVRGPKSEPRPDFDSSQHADPESGLRFRPCGVGTFRCFALHWCSWGSFCKGVIEHWQFFSHNCERIS